MSREIKFRAFCRVQKKMFYPKGLQKFEIFYDGSWSMLENEFLPEELENEITCSRDEKDEEYREFYDGVLMQYVGLKDIINQDVYECDYLNIGTRDFGFLKNDKGENVKYEVRFEKCEYKLYRTDTQELWGRLSRLVESDRIFKVVGNTFDENLYDDEV